MRLDCDWAAIGALPACGTEGHCYLDSWERIVTGSIEAERGLLSNSPVGPVHVTLVILQRLVGEGVVLSSGLFREDA